MNVLNEKLIDSVAKLLLFILEKILFANIQYNSTVLMQKNARIFLEK